MNVPSADISQFIILTTYDLSGDTPQVCLQAASVGPNEALVKYIYKIYTPSGTLIHNGSFTSPDAVGNATVFCVDLPLFNGTIEPSGPDYIVVATMQDQAELEFSQTISTKICPPRGNEEAGLWFAQACLGVEVDCDRARILLHDKTDYGYRGLTKTKVSQIITLIFPADNSGLQPPPFIVDGFADVAVPITSSGLYEARLVTIYDYNAGNDATIRIKYTTEKKAPSGVHIPVSVECFIDLCPLICEYTDFVNSTEKLCGQDDVKYAKNQRILSLINGKILSVMINKSCGKPVGKLIQEIKNISGFKCNCDCSGNGVVPRSLISSYSGGTLVFNVVDSCGDIVGVFTNPQPNHYQLTLEDKSYIFDLSDNAETYGFSVTPSLNGCVKTYTLDVDITTLIENILETIDDNGTLKAALCALVAQCDPSNPFNGVDMLCISPVLNNTCDYFGQLFAGQAHHPFDTFQGIQINGVIYNAPTGLIYTDEVNINLWLVSLGFWALGTEYVNAAGTVSLTVLANINSITRLYFYDPALRNIYSVNVSATGCGTVTSTDKMQAIVTFICNIYSALYGIDPVLYKVKSHSASNTPGYLSEVAFSANGSVQIGVIGDQVNFQTILKVDAADYCPGNMVDKIESVYLQVKDTKVSTYSYDYSATGPNFGAGYTFQSITIKDVTYTIDQALITGNLTAIAAAINALGLGTFTVTSPAANIVVESVGNIYPVNYMTIKTNAGPVYITYDFTQINPILIGECAKLFIEPRDRTWTSLAVNARYDPVTAVCEHSSLDSLRNVMININLVFDPAVIAGTYSVNAVPIAVGLRPRTDQKILVKGGWDGVSLNAFNYIIIHDTGFIEVEYNNPMSAEALRIDSFYYPTN